MRSTGWGGLKWGGGVSHPLRLGRGPSRACWELLQVPYEHSPRTCTAGTVALTPARCLLTEDSTVLLDSTVA